MTDCGLEKAMQRNHHIEEKMSKAGNDRLIQVEWKQNLWQAPNKKKKTDETQYHCDKCKLLQGKELAGKPKSKFCERREKENENCNKAEKSILPETNTLKNGTRDAKLCFVH